jgi:hypothetical protein
MTCGLESVTWLQVCLQPIAGSFTTASPVDLLFDTNGEWHRITDERMCGSPLREDIWPVKLTAQVCQVMGLPSDLAAAATGFNSNILFRACSIGLPLYTIFRDRPTTSINTKVNTCRGNGQAAFFSTKQSLRLAHHADSLVTMDANPTSRAPIHVFLTGVSLELHQSDFPPTCPGSCNQSAMDVG